MKTTANTELAAKYAEAILDARVAELRGRTMATQNRKWQIAFKLEDQLKASTKGSF
jgi:hypothetical protein